MERTPFKVPLSCYGLSLDLHDAVCQRCPHKVGCYNTMGRRKYRVSLDKAVFKLVPPEFRLAEPEPDEDPEFVHMDYVLDLCHRTIFGEHAKLRSGTLASEIARHARKARCSIRLFILANMVGHRARQSALTHHSPDRVYETPFSVNALVGERALKNAQNYADLCRNQFGTFTLRTVDMLTKTDRTGNDLETLMLKNEILAGSFILGMKIKRGGAVSAALWQRHELDLDPHWLAIELSYMKEVIEPHLTASTGSPTIRRHRHNVVQVHRELKRNRNAAVAVHYARENIMAEAVRNVLAPYHFAPDHFEVSAEPLTDAFEFWKELARAIQHYYCLRLLKGDREVFKR